MEPGQQVNGDGTRGKGVSSSRYWGWRVFGAVMALLLLAGVLTGESWCKRRAPHKGASKAAKHFTIFVPDTNRQIR